MVVSWLRTLSIGRDELTPFNVQNARTVSLWVQYGERLEGSRHCLRLSGWHSEENCRRVNWGQKGYFYAKSEEEGMPELGFNVRQWHAHGKTELGKNMWAGRRKGNSSSDSVWVGHAKFMLCTIAGPRLGAR